MTEEEISQLFKVYKTLIKMMEDRGYDVQIDSIDKEKWKNEIKRTNSMTGLFSKKIDKDDPSKKIRLFYYYIPSPKINSNSIITFLELIKESKANSGLIIMSGKISQQAKQKIQDINNILQIEIFTLGELVVNITEHELVPKHLLLSKEEKDLLLKRYKIKENQLPKILITDPVARYLGLKRGDVVKIIRVSETAGGYITYRIAC